MLNFTKDGNYFIFVCEFEFMTQKVPFRKSVANLLLHQCLCNLYVVCMCCNTESLVPATVAALHNCEGNNSKALQTQTSARAVTRPSAILLISSRSEVCAGMVSLLLFQQE